VMTDGNKLSTILAIETNKNLEHDVLDTIVIRTPYSAKGMFSLIPAIAPKLIQKFHWVLQDCRGRYDSDGDFAILDEEQDTLDTLNWITKQNWSNNRVHIFGPSYLGWVALQVIQKNSNATIVSVFAPMTFSNLQEGVITTNGMLNLHHSLAWSMMMSTKVQPSISLINEKWDDFYYKARRKGPILAGWPNRVWDSFSKIETLANKKIEFYEDHSFATKITLVASYFDFICDASLKLYVELAEIGGVPPNMIIGPWGHNGYLSSLGSVGKFELNEEGKGNIIKDLNEHFSTLTNGGLSKSAIKIFILRKGVWVNFLKLPEFKNKTVYYLSSKNQMSLKLDTQDVDELIIQANITNPVKTNGGPCWDNALATGLLPGPVDQRGINNRDDILKFYSSPLEEDIVIMSKVKIKTYIKASKVASTITGKLNVVLENGEEVILQNGITKVNNTDDYQNIDIDLSFTSVEIKKGEKLMVELSWSNFPFYNLPDHDSDYKLWISINQENPTTLEFANYLTNENSDE
ncbi:MAG: CocE/NonD family hydrolase, partial [Candidatus Heimdallarchaeota archaeon]|nr:CocE/NonD family hydrolase [Candidatus Heimdallarchaeota archaeon]